MVLKGTYVCVFFRGENANGSRDPTNDLQFVFSFSACWVDPISRLETGRMASETTSWWKLGLNQNHWLTVISPKKNLYQLILRTSPCNAGFWIVF